MFKRKTKSLEKPVFRRALTKWHQTFRLSLKLEFSSQIWTQLPNQMGHKITLKTSWIDSRSLRCKSAFNSLKRKKRLTHLIYAFRRSFFYFLSRTYNISRMFSKLFRLVATYHFKMKLNVNVWMSMRWQPCLTCQKSEG